MAAPLSPAEEQSVKEYISLVNELRRCHNAGPLCWNTAVKFMMARKFDIRRALNLYESHEITRRRECLVRFDPTNEPLKSELDTGKFTVLPTRDSSGAAIAVFTAGKHLPLETTHQSTLQGVVYQLDVALESFDTQRFGIVFVYNMSGSKYANFDYELSQKILSLLKGGYPARLKKVLIVTAPLWFKAPFKILRLFVREKLRDRVYMVNVPQLAHHIPSSSLPRELGGTLNMDHKAWLLHCLKSTANRYGDLCDLSPLPITSTSSTIEAAKDDAQQEGERLQRTTNGMEEETAEQFLVRVKHNNAEDREKEVEVTKDSHRKSNSLSFRDESSVTQSILEFSEGAKHQAMDDPLQASDPQGMIELDEFIVLLNKRGRKGLFEEYAEIKGKAPEGLFDTARLKNNQCKNRYTDVLCYDHSRVKVTPSPSEPDSDYINANFIDGYRQKNAFISTQGPLPKTFEDFWRMIWEQQSVVIVMTTRTVERSRQKCGQYWPKDDGAEAEYGPFKVANKGSEQHNDYILTALRVEIDDEVREVSHMQFTSWPDFGVPHSALAMLDFRNKVRDKQAKGTSRITRWQGHPLGPPIIVHCSAGIGRTGTFITLDICIKRLDDCGKINVRGTVERIRAQRAFSIQMPDQYVFCHLALLEYALSNGLLEGVDLSGFNDSDTESE